MDFIVICSPWRDEVTGASGTIGFYFNHFTQRKQALSRCPAKSVNLGLSPCNFCDMMNQILLVTRQARFEHNPPFLTWGKAKDR